MSEVENPLLRCRRFGWWSLLCWLTLGMALEAMHGFKVGWYLDVVNDGRRLQLTLAHTHGTLLALINLVAAASLRHDAGPAAALVKATACLRWAAILMPVGFLLGGVFAMGADPGFPIVLVPMGGLLLFAGVLLAARSLGGADAGSASAAGGAPAAGSASPASKASPAGKGKKK